MCGIIGYAGSERAEPILLEGLRRVEYRGYDSTGLATLTESHLHLRKRAGRLSELVGLVREQPAPGTVGISHTRWATHGPATDVNAHPHIGGDNVVAVVHNGVIENYVAIKRQLEAEGVKFKSDTDTEVIAQLIAGHLNGDLVQAVGKALAQLKGTYGLAVISPRFPNQVVGARLGSPLVLGIGEGENFLASDPSALIAKTKKVVYLQDHQLCLIERDSWQILDHAYEPVEADVQHIDWDASDAEKGAYDHFMLKEI
jgi:glutamine---fructose-6-phosphate transaminase (isomerizing)